MLLCLLVVGFGIAVSVCYNVFAVFWLTALPSVFYAFLTISETGGLQAKDLLVVGLVALFQLGYFVGGIVLPTVQRRHLVRFR